MRMNGRPRKRAVTVREFLNPKNSPPKRSNRKKSSGKGRFLLRFGLVAGCVVLLCSITFSGQLWDFFKTAVSSHGALNGSVSAAGNASGVISLHKKPAWPGCSSVATRKMPTEKIAAKVRPCVVGIVQYQKNSLRESGEGSGIIASANGLIVTNNHVVSGAQRIEVVMADGKKLKGEVVGSDMRTDLAVVKINITGLSCAVFGNSDQCSVGEPVVAIGNPSGLKLAGSVTQGIISAVDRNVDVGNGPMNLIQTDAAINPGNSGGALVNMYGQIVGINSAKIAQTGYEGIGFSIPVNTVKPIVDSIVKYGYVKGRVRMGISCREVDEVTARLNNIPKGIYIDTIDPEGPGAQSGLMTGDIITAIDGKRTETTDKLILARDSHQPGDLIKLDVFRNKSQLTLELKLEEDRGDKQVMAQAGW